MLMCIHLFIESEHVEHEKDVQVSISLQNSDGTFNLNCCFLMFVNFIDIHHRTRQIVALPHQEQSLSCPKAHNDPHLANGRTLVCRKSKRSAFSREHCSLSLARLPSFRYSLMSLRIWTSNLNTLTFLLSKA